MEIKKINEYKKTQKKVNEKYIESVELEDPVVELEEAFDEWYSTTDGEWEEIKDNMDVDTFEEAAKQAQMEILTRLNKIMNQIVTSKSRVKMTLK